ncbi:hypothetical protein SEA_ABBA_69 [Arthrobacter phage Abba]|uniref:Uncharacterized protein n=1 Tax=Arthrobacter phage Abba TaxID=2713256 RepID=A0A6G8R365_9CAUD|nr:hypothetical protein HYQ28_gp69 [Arthrobacter phage Abba]QIN94398.1 hypothetical protein SEA_ABBA_69 [Arthrobacter phage Abba]
MSKLIEKRIASATSKLNAAYPGLKISLTDLGAGDADIRLVAKHGRATVADATLDRSFGVRELVAEGEQLIATSFGMAPAAEEQDDETAQGRAAEDPEPLLADTSPDEDEIDAEIVGGDPRDDVIDQGFAARMAEQVDRSISQAMHGTRHGVLALNIDVAVRFVDLQTAHVLIFGGDRLSVATTQELAIHAIAELVGDFASWGYLNSWQEPGKHAVTVQMRRLS